MRFKHDSLRTETTYREWIKLYIHFHGKRQPRKMGAPEVSRFLEGLSVVFSRLVPVDWGKFFY